MRAFYICLFCALLVGCVSSNPKVEGKADSLTVGVVQRDISVGMSQTEVVEALGSPNMVTRDKEGKESWVYDKIASTAT